MDKNDTLRYYTATFSGPENDQIKIPFATNFPSTLPVIRIRELVRGLREAEPKLQGKLLTSYTPTTTAALKQEYGTIPKRLPKICHEKTDTKTTWDYEIPDHMLVTEKR